MAYFVKFYGEPNKLPVQKFMENLRKGNKQERKLFEKLSAHILLLQEQVLSLPFPYRSHVRNKIHELRAKHGNPQGRILFACELGEVVLLHAILKNAAVMSEKDIKLAEERWKKFKTKE